MQKTVAWGVSAVLVGGLAVGYYVWQTLVPRDAPIASLDVFPESKPQVRAEPQIRYPIERIPPQGAVAQATAPLPPLGSSDAEVQDALARLIGRAAFAQLVRPEEMIRHIVATVDNLPRRTVAPRLWPINPVPGGYIPPGRSESATAVQANAARYAPYVTAFEALDSHKLAAVYAYFYPLFQQAYSELGYPNVYFNDRLIEAIDIMLATPDVPEPIALVQPRVVYQYADPDLEALPAGQKILLRMGSDNAAHVKAKLTEIRQAVTGAGAMPMPAAGAASVPAAPARSSTPASGG